MPLIALFRFDVTSGDPSSPIQFYSEFSYTLTGDEDLCSVHEGECRVVPEVNICPLKKFGIVHSNGEISLVAPYHICCIEANNKHTRFFYYDNAAGKYLMAGSNESFGKVLKRLPLHQFIQCHRSWMVNPAFVTGMIPDKKNGGILTCIHPLCGPIPYSDSFKSSFSRHFNLSKC